jgi:hypothetical protein
MSEIKSNELSKLFEAAKEDKTIALMKDGTLAEINPNIDFSKAERALDKKQIEKLILDKVFGKDVLGINEFKSCIELFLLGYRNTTYVQKKELLKKYKINVDISGNRGRKKNK